MENNGGFASVRSPLLKWNLDDYSGIALRVRGDGKTYGFILRCAGVARLRWQAAFYTEPDLWETVYVPFTRFIPHRFGTHVWGAPPLNVSTITSCGLIISDEQVGPFQLEIAWIAAYPMTK